MTVLKFTRLNLGLTQDELSQTSGVARWKIALSERGLLSLNRTEIDALAGSLSVEPDDLLDASEPVSRDYFHLRGKK